LYAFTGHADVRLNADRKKLENSVTHTDPRPDKHDLGPIASLCAELKIPAHEVGAIYREELERLAAGARISAFLDILAMSNTRSILRRARGHIASN